MQNSDISYRYRLIPNILYLTSYIVHLKPIDISDFYDVLLRTNSD
jgi:hypothetical protein